MIDPRLVLGLATALLSSFGRYRFPAVPHAVSQAGIVAGLGLLAWLFMPTLAWQAAVPTIVALSLVAALFTLLAERRGMPGIRRVWLYAALRYLARDSAWAASLPLERDTWGQEVDTEFLRGVTEAGGLVAHGRRYEPTREQAPREIDPEFWRRVDDFSAFWIMETNAIKHSLHSKTGEAFTEIYFDRKQLHARWKPRSLIARLRRQSPPERWGTDKFWKDEDAKNDARERAILDAPNRRPSQKH
jgi:hypothetical protein